MARAKKVKTEAPAQPLLQPLRVILEPTDAPVYANYAEVSASQHEFQISFALTPSKPSPQALEEAKSGSIHLDTIVQILLPATLIPGLIKALTTTKDQYETITGPIKEMSM
jgi:hypothetical protein